MTKHKDIHTDDGLFDSSSPTFKKEEHDLADFVVHETAEERIASFVEDFKDAYVEDAEEVYMMLQDIYADLEHEGHVDTAEDEIMEVLKRLKKKTGK
jgi:hypothetical protein